MKQDSTQRSFYFRRRVDGLVYQFNPSPPVNGRSAWKREDLDLWVTQNSRLDWVCIDEKGFVLAIPWQFELKQSSLPPSGEWISKKGDRSYAYDLVFI